MKQRKIILLFLLCSIFLLVFPVSAHADMGPKDSLTVYVINPPQEEYYLDLLTQTSGEFSFYGDDETYNQEMLALLYSYEDEGWLPALTEGTQTPMWGKLTGEPDGNRMVHKFWYYGVPETYRIIIVTESGNVSVSDVYTRASLQSSITYDYNTGEAAVPSAFTAYVIQFLSTLVPTLILEGIILLLFGFALKENWKVFLAVNLITQVLLTLTVGTALIRGGSLAAFFIQIPAEIVIIVGEALAYRRFLVGRSKGRRAAYGVVANLASWIAGYFVMNYLSVFLSGIL